MIAGRSARVDGSTQMSILAAIQSMSLPANLLIGDDLCKLKVIQSPSKRWVAYYTVPRPHTDDVAEHAGYELLGEGMSEEHARRKLERICQLVNVLGSKWYAKK